MNAQTRPRRIIFILGALSTISPLAIDMYLPAFQQMALDFQTTPAEISLSVSSYFIGLALGQLFYGPLLDRFGRKRPLYFGLSLFVLASLGCLWSRSVVNLIVLRFVQALGGCAAQVASMAMVRDFFPAKDASKVFSILMLILSVSPLLAPTFGGFITVAFGWHGVFLVLTLIVASILAVVYFWLPEGAAPDHAVTLRLKPIARSFGAILKIPQFHTYALSGALSFSALFVYVAGAPIIFMEVFQVSARTFGGIFALLSVGFIGGSQLNILLAKHFPSEKIYFVGQWVRLAVNCIFLAAVLGQVLGLYSTIFFFFLSLLCLGVIHPNAAALALSPFSRNAGSASAMLGFLQMGTGALISSAVGVFAAKSVLPVIIIFVISNFLALGVLVVGRKRIANAAAVELAREGF